MQVALRLFVAALLLSGLVIAHDHHAAIEKSGHDHDESFYRTARYGIGDPYAQCWRKPFGTNTSIPVECPPGLNINFTYANGWPSDDGWFLEDTYPIEFIMTGSISDITSSPDITHANVHGCLQDVGFCSPLLAESDLVTFWGQFTGDFGADNTSVVTSPVSFSTAGTWTIICHGRVNRTINSIVEQWDFAFGLPIKVRRHAAFVAKAALVAIGVIAGLVAVVAVVMLFGILVYRKHKVIRAATFPFCIIMLVCGLFALSTIIPLGHEVTDGTCVAIPWLLAPATCLTLTYDYNLLSLRHLNYLLSLLTLRLFRVYVLFGNTALHPDMQRYWYLRNIYLLFFAVMITGVQVVMLIIWTSIDDWRPRKVEANSALLTSDACGSRSPRAMPALYWLFVAMDVIILGAAVVLAFVTRRVTTLFNESKAIALITYTFVFVGFVIIPIQKLVDDRTGVFVLRSMGIILSVGAAIALLFAPKFWVIFTTKRSDLHTDFAGSSVSLESTTSSSDDDVPRNSSAQPGAPKVDLGTVDKKTIEKLDTATSRAVMLLEKHKTGFRVSPQELNDVLESLGDVVRGHGGNDKL